MRTAQEILKDKTYIEMTKEELEIIIPFELEKYKPLVDRNMETLPVLSVLESIHEWWKDYDIADETEDMLNDYVIDCIMEKIKELDYCRRLLHFQTFRKNVLICSALGSRNRG